MSAPEPLPQNEADRGSFDTLLASYLDLIRDIAEAVELIRPEISSSCYQYLRHARTRLAKDSSNKALEETRKVVHEELKLFSEKARQFGDTQSVRNNRYAERLAQMAEHIELTIQSGDVRRLPGQAAELRDFAHSMQEENRDALAHLQQAELLAYLDPLTSVPNRREFDRQLATRLAAPADFCILLFDLDRFKSVNDRFGHLCGDEILRQLGARLSRQVRTRDFVCRWGGDEFVVILDCGLPTATARAAKIAQWLSGPYRVVANGEEHRIEVSVSFGVAQRIPGETPEQLFHRVDESLYSQKGSAGQFGLKA
ncbi:MAG TPA: GGDEF domain-containing protein [Bryobacteraceae bacterium]|nr:GGDEF domain-containing protein [Bryobacteraceae bacterium]